MESQLETARNNDIREWSFDDRNVLASGSRIEVYCGETRTSLFPRLMLATVSTLQQVHSTPSHTKKNAKLLLPGNIHPSFVQDILTWLWNWCTKDDPSKKNVEATRTIWGDLNQIRAARLLGMEK